MEALISKQLAIEALIQKLYEKPEEYWDNGLNRYDIEETINALQPEIIYCGDCKWHNGEINQYNAQICASMCSEDFCSRAEKIS